MNNRMEKLKQIWALDNISNSITVNDDEIKAFQMNSGLVIPKDLVDYFKQFNGSNEVYDDRFFRFYSFQDFKSVDNDLVNFSGVPDYSNIVNTLSDFQSYYVFADYTFCMFTYAIKLYSHSTANNEVLVLCGAEYKVIANSFSEFIDLYIDNSIELQLNQ
jgi:hypothetical protein